ncbi:hypothetical protein G7Z17_g2711 [Cylindrodendrum hubeiense]|uniref:BZIP domain-containing protein n=1 Tax=Cylindrodendrum hubeiense TaxID=595255 RepID=A0A9P5LE84_9HYPO|nr:hypothetical protein G7Z17_g2711 [Cylindrodendrum hubeiense]
MDSESPVESTVQAESGGRKRKVLTRTDKATDRKRTQNRISQQCARERQTAYIRQMESFIDLLRSSTEKDTNDTEYTKLLKAHLKLLDDKRNAEESLFRFRQKLLSVGNMATSAAEDPIFQSLNESPTTNGNSLASEPNAKVSPSISSSSPETSPTIEIGDSALIVDQQPSQPLGTNNISGTHLAQEANLGDIPPWQPDMDIFFRQYTATTQLSHSTIPSPMSFPILGSSWPLPQISFPSASLDTNDVMGSMMGIQHPQVPAFVQITQSSTAGLMVVNNSTIFADQVRSAAKYVMLTSMQSASNYTSTNSPPAYNSELVERLASVAVEVIGALAGLQTYIYGVLEDRLAIPPPFRPTPLQAATPDHPMVIDFINWPSIRDHMILYSASLDLDAMSRDIVLNTVIELPQNQVAVNIYELFFTHILPKVRGGQGEVKDSMLHNPEWVYLTVPPNPTPASLPTILSPTQEALAAEIAEKMGLQLQDLQCPDSVTPQSVNMNGPSRPMANTRSAPCGPQMIMTRALKSFGIDQPSNWKLSKDFARKYYNVDCSLDVSQYQMVSCKAVDFEKTDL